MILLDLDSKKTDDQRRAVLFQGRFFVYSPKPSSAAVCGFARALIEKAFPVKEPQKAQFDMPVEKFVEIAGPLKSQFTNDPETKKKIQAMLKEFGCDLARTYFDVPRLRIVTHGGYLTAGVGYAYKPHRDTWYAGDAAQVNWWFPVYALEAECALSFYPTYWNRAVLNSSKGFDYEEWCRVGRPGAASQITQDTRNHPLPLEKLDESGEFRVVCSAGSVILFSAAQLHATYPNASGVTRFSIDFRTIHESDIRDGRGAPNADSKAVGSTLSDFIRASDFQPWEKK